MARPRALAGHRRIGLDTTVLIYALEPPSPFNAAAQAVLAAVDQGLLNAVVSTLLIAELLVRPYRAGEEKLVAGYLRYFETSTHLDVIAPGVSICRLAAQLRASTTALKLPDAIHIATALESNASAFVTNDASLRSTGPLKVIQLADMVES